MAPLLFLDGWRIPKEGLFRDKWTILALGFGLVLFTVAGAGLFIHWLIPTIPLPVAFALAAVLSPTDAVAVSAIAERVPIPRRLMHILEGESLLNDASGLVCLRFATAAAVTGTFSLGEASTAFLWLAVGGVGPRYRGGPHRERGKGLDGKTFRGGHEHADPDQPAHPVRCLAVGRPRGGFRHPGGRRRRDCDE